MQCFVSTLRNVIYRFPIPGWLEIPYRTKVATKFLIDLFWFITKVNKLINLRGRTLTVFISINIPNKRGPVHLSIKATFTDVNKSISHWGCGGSCSDSDKYSMERTRIAPLWDLYFTFHCQMEKISAIIDSISPPTFPSISKDPVFLRSTSQEANKVEILIQLKLSCLPSHHQCKHAGI